MFPLWPRSPVAAYGLFFGERFLLAARCRSNDDAAIVHRDLPLDLVSPSAIDLNVSSVAGLAQIAEGALAELGCRAQPVTLLLSDLSLRAFALPSRARSVERLLPEIDAHLPYPVSEARVDSWDDGRGGGMIAAIRAPVLEQYESVLTALDCRPVWVDGASLVLIPRWARELSDTAGRSKAPFHVHAQLYRRHFTLVAFREGRLVDFRTRLRTPSLVRPVLDELRRLPEIYPEDGPFELTVWGASASRVAEEMEADAPKRYRGVAVGQDDEEAFLQSALCALVSRIV